MAKEKIMGSQECTTGGRGAEMRRGQVFRKNSQGEAQFGQGWRR
jgi:hypothetical protein